MKERLGMTEMRKAANRVIFGEVKILTLVVNFCSTFDFIVFTAHWSHVLILAVNDVCCCRLKRKHIKMILV